MKQSLDSSPIHHKLCVCTVSAVLASKVGETKYRRKKLSSSHFPSLAAAAVAAGFACGDYYQKPNSRTHHQKYC